LFKKNILAKYPRANRGLRYTIRDLEHLILNTAESKISTEMELLQYYRQFSPILVWLMANSKISSRERDRYFLQGLPHSVRKAIDRHLELKEKNYTRNEAPDIEKALEAGQFVLSDDAYDADLHEPIVSQLHSIQEARAPKPKPLRQGWDSDKEDERRDARREVQTRRVAFKSPTPPPIKTTLDEVDDLARKMHTLDIGDAAYAGCYTRLLHLSPAATQIWPPPKSRHLVNTISANTSLQYLPLPPLPNSASQQSNAICFFCGGPHIMRACLVTGEYLRAGRIIHDGQYFAFPDRSRIRRIGNETFKQVIDMRYAMPISPTPATGSNAIPIEESRRETKPPPLNEIPSLAFISKSYFLQCIPVAENHAVVTTVEEEGNEQEQEVLAITRSKTKNARTVDDPSNQKQISPSVPTTLPTPTNDERLDPPKAPAFKYESKAAALDAVRCIHKDILSTVVPHLTVSDLLAISPELRKEAVEHCQMHRVPVLTASTSPDTTDSKPPPVQVEHATPLRELQVTLNGTHSELGLLDEGSEIVVV